MGAGSNNLAHAMTVHCTDPDCEIHHPEVIEFPESALTALAWFFAGVNEVMEVLADQTPLPASDRNAIYAAIVEAHGAHHDNWKDRV